MTQTANHPRPITATARAIQAPIVIAASLPHPLGKGQIR